MISVCIPVYNQDVSILVNRLEEQAKQISPPAEIILIDDASSEIFKTINRPLQAKLQYIELPQNIGRAKIRNLFLDYASMDYLLFIDCDSLLIADDFLANYAKILHKKYPVLVGGSIYQADKPERKQRLRWKYGTKRESKSYQERMKRPNQSFMTNNFIIHRSIFELIRFDERLTEYGHEDTLFGFSLKQAGIMVNHIDNPVLNKDIDENKIFLEKTEKGIENLNKIITEFEYPDSLQNEVSLLRMYQLIKKQAFLWRNLHQLHKPFFRALLHSGYAPLLIFNIYKLGYFFEVKARSKSAD